MDVAITGASGLIGTALSQSLTTSGHRPVALVRRPANGADEITWNPAAGTIDAASLEGIDAVVHLAGAGIGDKRWNDERKQLDREVILQADIDPSLIGGVKIEAGGELIALIEADESEDRPGARRSSIRTTERL